MEENYEIVNDIRLLKKMEKEKLIKLHFQTGTKIKGIYGGKSFTCYYIDEAPSYFEYNNQFYGEKYFDGCFYPYLVRYNSK